MMNKSNENNAVVRKLYAEGEFDRALKFIKDQELSGDGGLFSVMEAIILAKKGNNQLFDSALAITDLSQVDEWLSRELFLVLYGKVDGSYFENLLLTLPDMVASNEFFSLYVIDALKKNYSFSRVCKVRKIIFLIIENRPHLIKAIESIVSDMIHDDILENLGDIDSILSADLTKQSMKSFFIRSAAFERVLYEKRRSIFERALAERQFSPFDEEMIHCIAVQQYHKEYCMYVNEYEEHALGKIKIFLDNALSSRENLGQAVFYLCLYSMYENPKNINGVEKILDYSLPYSLKNVLYFTVESEGEIHKLEGSIRQLVPISSGASEIVRAQYEENPYPRWQSIKAVSSNSYMDFLKNECHGRLIDVKPFSKNPEILVAGCGTGQQPISIAQALPFSSITAIDLSKRSLAYAKYKSIEHGIDNIDFYHADILNLEELHKKYDVIECCGVLHHMEFPEKGLKALVGSLKDDGLMRIAVYSTNARTAIEKNRMMIKERGLVASIKNIRNYRASLLKECSDEIIEYRDFYNTSECRDLIFNTHEKTYNWLEFSEFLLCQGLKIVTVNAPREVELGYMEKYPKDKFLKNVDNWHQYEIENPRIFLGMMACWVSKIC